jgi:hypothetical protein
VVKQRGGLADEGTNAKSADEEVGRCCCSDSDQPFGGVVRHIVQGTGRAHGGDGHEDGVPVIVAVPCPDERVVTMGLLDAESVLEGPLTTYWRVRSDQAVVGKTYMLPINNQPPAAFELVVRLAGDLPEDLALLAEVGTLSNAGDPAGAAREFRIEDLQVGEVLARGGQLVSFDEFITSARDAC